ncbi:MAG: EamA family transporter [Opitutales bacterium]|nr:EamA family transporter [Opitutales bacterium]NRA27843.1 EamA family transporter [Opitutales bacterium]
MLRLLSATLIWAFSFGLIGSQLTGLDAGWVALCRLLTAVIVFSPFLWRSSMGARDLWVLCGIGAVQFGLMYSFYLSAFQFIEAYLVAAFTAFTPIWVALIGGLWERKLDWAILSLAVFAFLGAWIIRESPLLDGEAIWIGFALMQIANFCFACGQVAFRRWSRQSSVPAHRSMLYLYVGGAGVALLYFGARVLLGIQGSTSPSLSQIGIIVYLGVIASGLGFFLWNSGAAHVSNGVLAVSNNWVVPVGVALAIPMAGSQPDWPSFGLGATVIVAASVGVELRARSMSKKPDQSVVGIDAKRPS